MPSYGRGLSIFLRWLDAWRMSLGVITYVTIQGGIGIRDDAYASHVAVNVGELCVVGLPRVYTVRVRLYMHIQGQPTLQWTRIRDGTPSAVE